MAQPPPLPLLFLVLVLVVVILLLARATWAVVSCYYLTPRRIRSVMSGQGVGGPEPRFLLGNLADIAALVRGATVSSTAVVDHDIVGRLLPHYQLWSRRYGRRFVFWYGSEPRLCLTEPGLIKELLSPRCANASGKSWMQQEGAKHLIGGGVLMANGRRWSHQRRVVAPSFMPDKLKGQVGYMVECTRETIGRLAEAVGGAGEVEIGGYMSRLAGEIICRTEFGCRHDKAGEEEILRLLALLQRLTAQSSSHLWFPGARFFPSKFRTEIKALKAEVDTRLMEIIRSKRDAVWLGRSSSYGGGLLATLLAHVKDDDNDDGDDNGVKKGGGSSPSSLSSSGSRYSLRLVMDECKTFLFAGHDTSAQLLTWAIMLLATNPPWQDKAREEVARVCGDAPPTVDHLPKLTLLQMIINETLRLYPPACLLPRMAFEDMKLGELLIPKGLSIWIPVLALHHIEDVWGADAHRFDPGRFAPGRRTAEQSRHFIPFAAGPRNCVGQAYAVMEAKVVLAMLLSSFSFAISGSYRHAPVNVLTLRPKHGVPVLLRPLLSHTTTGR